MSILNESPYFDDGVEQFKDKDYKQILFNPSVPLQAREATQIQTLMNEQLKENLALIYRDGSVIDGCILNLDSDNFLAYMTAGKFYSKGRVYNVEESNVAIAVVGEVKLGLQLVEEVIDSTADTALNDPASGTPNYNLPGADRLKQVWSFVNITESSPTVYKELWVLEDGLVVREDEKSEYSIVLDTIARRTFDESGHYLVNGMELSVNDYDETITTDYIKLIANPGKAYVKGYEVIFSYPHFDGVPKSQDLEQKSNENHTYNTGTLLYDLRQKYVKFTDHTMALSADVHVSAFTINHASLNGTDAIGSYENINSSTIIVSSDANETPEYTLNTDYYLTDVSGEWEIDWNTGGGSEPGVGVDYYVTFDYTKNMVENTDWQLINHATDEDVYQIEFLEVDLPNDATTFYIDYEYYLARTDLIQLDKDGALVVKEGQSTHWTETLIPRGSDEYLSLGYVKHMPNRPASECETFNYKYSRLTMRDLYNLRTRVQDIEFNQSELALEADAKGSELPTNLKGIFVDSFETFDKSNTTAVDFKCSLNIIDSELTKQVEYSTPTIDQSNDVLNNITLDIDSYISYASLSPTGESIALSITSKTGVENLNPYTFLLKPGLINIDPRMDSWVDEEIKYITNTNSVVVGTTTTTNTSWWNFRTARDARHSDTTTELLSTTVDKTAVIKESMSTFARLIPIQVYGDNWSENSHIEIFFDGDTIVATATGTTTMDSGFLVVEADGTFSGQIMVPAGTLTGEHRITFRDQELDLGTSAIFTSEGINRLITETTLTTRNLQRNTVISSRIDWEDQGGGGDGGGDDPISQSFKFKDGKTFSAIDLFFKSRDTGTEPAWMEIGYLVNGYPSRDTVFHEQLIPRGDVNTSVDGTVATKVEFNKPIYISPDTGFFITFGSKSDEYLLYVSELGGTDVETGNVVEKNPYLQGVFFKSSNNSTWTAFQSLDLTCNLYEGIYETVGSIETENLSGLVVSSFNFQNQEIVPVQTDISYSYSIDNGTIWNLFTPGTFVGLNSLASSLKFKMDFTGTGSVTPIVDTHSYRLVVSAFNTETDNYYVSKTVYNVPAFNIIRAIYDDYIPSGNSAAVYGSVGNDMWFPIEDDPQTPYYVDEIFQRKEFSTDIRQYCIINGTFTGTFAIGETVTTAAAYTGTILDLYDSGNAGEDYILIQMDTYLTEWDLDETVTGDTLGATIDFVTGDTLLNATQFSSKIKLNNVTALESPVIKNLKYIMKVDS